MPRNQTLYGDARRPPPHPDNDCFVSVRSATVLWRQKSHELPSDSHPTVLARRANPTSPVPASEEHCHFLRQCPMPRGGSMFAQRYTFEAGPESLRLQKSYRCSHQFPFDGPDSGGARPRHIESWCIHRLLAVSLFSSIISQMFLEE